MHARQLRGAPGADRSAVALVTARIPVAVRMEPQATTKWAAIAMHSVGGGDPLGRQSRRPRSGTDNRR